MKLLIALIFIIVGQVDIIPPDLQSAIILKTIPYVNNFKENDTLRIGLAYTDINETVKFNKYFKSKEVKGKILIVKRIDITSNNSIKNIDILLILPSIQQKHISSIKKDTEKNDIFSIALTESLKFVKYGISMGIVEENGKPKIIANKDGLKNEGISLDPRFIKLIKFVE